MNDVVIIHHAGCSDGICAAAVIMDYFTEMGAKDIQCIPAQYGDDIPSVTEFVNKHVFIVDFSYERDLLVDINSAAASLIVLDHHASAEENCAGLPFAFFDVERCGAEMAWDFCTQMYDRQWDWEHGIDETDVNHVHHDSVRGYPAIVAYVADRDLWSWKLNYSRQVSAYLESFPRNVVWWAECIKTFTYDSPGMQRAIAEGEAIERFKAGKVANIGSKAIDCKFSNVLYEKLRVKAVNSCDFQSEIGEYLLNQDDCDVAVVWFMPGNQAGVVHSVRTRGLISAKEIAVSYGGGGHHNAAGFKTSNIEVIVK